ASASVSPKTVEALFGTKAALLKTVVDFAIRGDLLDLSVNQRERAAAIDVADNATAMLDLHSSHVRTIQARTARIAWSVEVDALRAEALAHEHVVLPPLVVLLRLRALARRHPRFLLRTRDLVLAPPAADAIEEAHCAKCPTSSGRSGTIAAWTLTGRASF